MAGMFCMPAFFVPMKSILFLLIALSLTALFAKEPRVVSLTPALTETICFLGGESALVGRSFACDYPAHIKKLPAAGDYTGFYLEQLLKLNPDYIVVNDITQKAQKQKRHLKGKVIELPVRTIEDYIHSLRVLGEILNRKEQGKREAEKAAAKLAELKRKAELKKQKPSAIWIIWHKPLLIAGPGSLPDTIMKLTGLRNMAGNVKDEYFKCSLEWLAMQKPDYIIWTVNGVPFQAKGIWAGYDKKQVISGLNDDILLRPGPRIFDGIESLKKRCF